MGILVGSLATFGIGFFGAALGGLFFGALGDRIGRKNILLYTLSLMGAASFLIGCLPTYATISASRRRCVRATAFPAEALHWGEKRQGAQLMTMEHAPQNKRGLYGSFINTRLLAERGAGERSAVCAERAHSAQSSSRRGDGDFRFL